ncbi:MAG TPA: hypothetical protein VEZ17_03025, partial [Chitinophagaceae bacterium]|nr:hypothetical protein [Chitinophagaceae bacterium]
QADASCISKFRPQFTSSLYNTNVNVIGKHLSGLLIIKAMPDSSTRMVFTSETGLTFFDFEYSREGNFKVHNIIRQMNRKAVIRTLQKDFELVLMRNLNAEQARSAEDAAYRYTIFPQGKEYNYYITDPGCSQLERIEKTSKRKIKVSVIMKNYRNGVPDTIGITHHNFNFNIGLKLLER